jgi:GTP pyrophosphokinase
VDKKLVPINNVLKNGEQIEVINSKKQSPKDEWLNYVVTTRAKTSIKIALKNEKKKYGKSGKDKLEKWFLQAGLEFSHGNINQFMTANSFHSLIDLYYAVSQERTVLRDVKAFASANEKGGGPDAPSRTAKKSHNLITESGHIRIRELINTAGLQKIVNGNIDNLSFLIAPCCNPIPGDDIIGLVISENLPVQIHRTSCPKAIELISSFSNRFIKIDWLNADAGSFLTGIKIIGMDKMGMINELTKIISAELNLNIKSFHIEARNGLTEGEVKLFVQDKRTLNKLIENLKKIEGVTNVSRAE